MPQFALTSPDPSATREDLIRLVEKHSGMKPFFHEAARIHVSAERDIVDAFCRANPGWDSFEYPKIELDPSEIRPKPATKTFLQRLGFKS